MIELEHVTKLYGLVIGVNDMTLSLTPGAYGLLGPNGSGKTTLINLITGQLKPTIGRVRVFDHNPWNHAGLLRRLGYCPALDPAQWNVSALEWVAYLLELTQFSRSEANHRAVEILERVGLGDAMKRPIQTYSLGMRQRVKLAQALAHDPDWLILDEPFNGLDPIGRREMTDILQDWVRDGKSLLLSSHVLHEVEAITPSFLLLYGCRLLATGSADEIAADLGNVVGEVTVRGRGMGRVATELAADPDLISLQFLPHHAGIRMIVRSTTSFYERLQSVLASPEVALEELDSPDHSLSTLFSTLMKMHRGEAISRDEDAWPKSVAASESREGG